MKFCGQERCIIDGNGRIKLGANILRDFQENSDQSVILHCLVEGALAVYPPSVWMQMRGDDQTKEIKAANSVVFRRSLRRFGAFSLSAMISNQGRITIPNSYREHADLVLNSEIMVVGCEIGLEIWNCDRWYNEMKLIHQHVLDKNKNEMDADLTGEDIS